MKYIIKDLSFVFARKLLSKNKGTRMRNVPTICYKISQINALSFTHNECLSKGLKNWRGIKLWNSTFRCKL